MPDNTYAELVRDRQARLHGRAAEARRSRLGRALLALADWRRGHAGQQPDAPEPAPALTAGQLAERLGATGDQADVVIEHVTTVAAIRRRRDARGRPRVIVDLAEDAVLPVTDRDLEALLDSWAAQPGAPSVRARSQR